ncbi:MAG: hypothetical protein FJ031_10700 [Chloroflexi bacterium]|nr:hypothetical protein [Chloroflexota bacterium]
MAALFNPGTWQGNAIRVPGLNKTLNEQQSAQVVQAILPVLSCSAASQVRRVLAGEADTLTFVAHLEVDGLISGYLKRVPTL